MATKQGFAEAAAQADIAEKLVKRLLTTARDLSDGLSNPSFVSVPKEFTHLPRNSQNPPFWAVPPEIANAPWNMSDEELLATGPDRFTVTEKILGSVFDFHEVTKTKDGYVGLPENGARGPGIMGVGYTEDGLPIPVTSGSDFMGFALEDGRLKLLLGERPALSADATIMFTLIGGFVGKGESAREAAVREFLEEAVSASYKIEEDLEQAFINRKTDPAAVEAVAAKYGLDVSIFKEPAMPEFKFGILQARKPEAIAELAAFMDAHLSPCYEALARGAGRSCSRQIFVNIYSGLIDFDALNNIFTKHDLALEGSDEIGRPQLHDLADIQSNRMFGSQGLFVLYGLADVLSRNPALAANDEIVQQIHSYIGSAENHLKAVNEVILARGGESRVLKPI